MYVLPHNLGNEHEYLQIVGTPEPVNAATSGCLKIALGPQKNKTEVAASISQVQKHTGESLERQIFLFPFCSDLFESKMSAAATSKIM